MPYHKRKVGKRSSAAPVPDKPDFSAPPTIAVSILLKMKQLRAMSLLSSYDYARYVLNGVLLQFDGSHLVLVATDGRKLSVLNLTDCLPSEGDTREPFSYIIPNELIQDAARLFPGRDASVWVEFDSKVGVTISAFGKTLQGKVIEGKFPDWRKCVPTSPPIEAAKVNLSAELLQHFAQAAKLLSRVPYIYVRGHKEGNAPAEHCPFSVRFSEDYFYGIIMPIRASEEHVVNGSTPAWVLPKAA